MAKDFEKLINKLNASDTIIKKIQCLNADPDVISFINSHPNFLNAANNSIEDEYVLKILMTINQAENIFYNIENVPNYHILLKEFCKTLTDIDNFYSAIGGIIGYHNAFLNLLQEPSKNENIKYYETTYFDLTNCNHDVEELINVGLDNLNKFAFIFPMGGAGDRLKLFDPVTKHPLPVAKLDFQGHTLLEILIRDLRALEYLYWKTYNIEITVPIVIMTSDEKDNHKHIISILEEKDWFDRDKNSFCFIKQISAPVIAENGNWTLQAPLKLALKPSGHGVLWHLMSKKKIFDFLESRGKEKAIVRQINNPIAGTDYLILAFMGIGIKNNKAFGFASCPRISGYKEGLVALKEKSAKNGFYYNISNIEYTEFKKFGLDETDNSNYFSNTNILFADLKEVKKASILDPFPGLTINLKNKVFSKTKDGGIVEINAGRLESMMQSIADSIQDCKEEKIDKKNIKDLKTFVSLSPRKKTISTTKNAYKEGSELFETPVKCYYDYLNNYHDLLKNFCKVDIPPICELKDFLIKGPSFYCSLNPMMGPLYSIISKKIIGGKITYGSELDLEIAEVLIENIYLDGSLIIETKLTKNTAKDIYNTSSCTLSNVTIKNLGLDKQSNNNNFQNKLKRKEYFKIILGENSHFYANNIEFLNTNEIIVPSFHKMFILKSNEKVIYKVEKI
ncbi:MAG: UTP--glucose-1-phosphate uridylyltransferase [Parachlamydiales bacterium]|jgi:UDP-N-acetylglucosamine pyrophosphorylase